MLLISDVTQRQSRLVKIGCILFFLYAASSYAETQKMNPMTSSFAWNEQSHSKFRYARFQRSHPHWRLKFEKEKLILSFLYGVNFEHSGKPASVLGILGSSTYDGGTVLTTPVTNIALGYLWGFLNRGWQAVNLEVGYTAGTSPYATVHPLSSISIGFASKQFNYEIRHFPLLATYQVGSDRQIGKPYGILGLGVSFNRAYNYNEIPSDPAGSAAAMRSMFRSHAQTGLAWLLGLGFRYNLSPSRQLALEYRFMNYGRAKLLPPTFSDGYVNSSLSLGASYSNQLLLKFTFNLI